MNVREREFGSMVPFEGNFFHHNVGLMPDTYIHVLIVGLQFQVVIDVREITLPLHCQLYVHIMFG